MFLFSKYFEDNQNNHLLYRHKIFEFIKLHKEKFNIFFEGNVDENDNLIDKNILLDEYINNNNMAGKYAGDIEISAFVLLYNCKLIVFEKGFKYLNVLNVYFNNDKDPKEINNVIYLLYDRMLKHYSLLKIKENNTNELKLDINLLIEESIKKNIEYRKYLNRKEYPVCTKSSPNTYNEIYEYLKNNNLPERFMNNKNKSLYISRFKKW